MSIILQEGLFQASSSLIYNLRQSGKCTRVLHEDGTRSFEPKLCNDFMLQVSINHSKDESIYNDERKQAFINHVVALLNANPFKE